MSKKLEDDRRKKNVSTFHSEQNFLFSFLFLFVTNFHKIFENLFFSLSDFFNCIPRKNSIFYRNISSIFLIEKFSKNYRKCVIYKIHKGEKSTNRPTTILLFFSKKNVIRSFLYKKKHFFPFPFLSLSFLFRSFFALFSPFFQFFKKVHHFLRETKL